jgi:predicted DNA-binding transcriptional regulator YafY
MSLPPLLEEAIRFKKSVHICYLSRTGDETRRVVTPLKIHNRFDYLCLEAFCSLRNEKRMFRLDRILKIKII